jgi:hypothetical protein
MLNPPEKTPELLRPDTRPKVSTTEGEAGTGATRGRRVPARIEDGRGSADLVFQSVIQIFPNPVESSQARPKKSKEILRRNEPFQGITPTPWGIFSFSSSFPADASEFSL